VPPEALPSTLRRFEPLRRLGVRVVSLALRRMDLAIRPYSTSFGDARERLEAAIGRGIGDAVEPLRPRPKLVESIALAVEERDRASSLDRATLRRVHGVVERSLPHRPEDTTGFHPRPPDPVDAFAFVGTRYAGRTTTDQIVVLRRTGLDDLAILDLAIAVADANQWARMYRLAGLPANLFSLATERPLAQVP